MNEQNSIFQASARPVPFRRNPSLTPTNTSGGEGEKAGVAGHDLLLPSLIIIKIQPQIFYF